VAGAWRPQPTDYIIMTTDGRLVHCGLWIAAIAESSLTLPVWVLELPLDVAQRLLDASLRGKGGPMTPDPPPRPGLDRRIVGFGQKIRLLRETTSCSQATLTAAVGYSRSAIANLES
jgi:hypothetical protein